MNTHYEDTARWMNRNIPAGEIIYHASWSDSPYFICLNPKNNYLVVLDPIYMFYRYPTLYKIYEDLRYGKIKKPYRIIKKMFKAKYGYTSKLNTGLFYQINKDKKHFKILYEDNMGIVFKVMD